LPSNEDLITMSESKEELLFDSLPKVMNGKEAKIAVFGSV